MFHIRKLKDEKNNWVKEERENQAIRNKIIIYTEACKAEKKAKQSYKLHDQAAAVTMAVPRSTPLRTCSGHYQCCRCWALSALGYTGYFFAKRSHRPFRRRGLMFLPSGSSWEVSEAQEVAQGKNHSLCRAGQPGGAGSSQAGCPVCRAWAVVLQHKAAEMVEAKHGSQESFAKRKWARGELYTSSVFFLFCFL